MPFRIDWNEVGRRFRAARGTATQEDFSARTGIAQGKISVIESGGLKRPGHEIAKKIEDVIGPLPTRDARSAQPRSDPPLTEINRRLAVLDTLPDVLAKMGETIAAEIRAGFSMLGQKRAGRRTRKSG